MATLILVCPHGSKDCEPLAVEMPDATTIKYAAKRIAEKMGRDPALPFYLRNAANDSLLEEGKLAIEYNNLEVVLCISRKDYHE